MRRVLAGLACSISLASATVHYRLSPQPSAKTILVSITIDAPKSLEIFRIPAWCPGYYKLASYQKKIFDVKATDGEGRSLPSTSLDARSWKVFSESSRQLTLSYKVLGDDPGLGFFAVNVGGDKAFVNGAAAFMYADNRQLEDVDLTIQNPQNWDVATSMPDAPDDKFSSANYDEFIDHPIQLGKFTRKKFTVAGVPFEAIYVAPDNTPRCDLTAETERLNLVSKPALKLFGGSGFKKYLYIIHLEIGNFNGGLEHRACNVQAVANSPHLNLDDLAAHEYFHAWNVKQIRPRILGPFDYSSPQRTANLWFAEGVTDYYSKLHTYQSGLKTESWLREELAEQIRQLQGGQTRKAKTVEDASRNCWEYDGFSMGDLSFYTKGLIVGFLFDAAIIDATNGTKTLDDVMRALYQKGKLPKAGYGEDDIRLAINEVAGKDLSALYTKMVRSTDELPYGLANKIGIRINLSNAGRQNSNPVANNEFDVEVDPSASPQAKALYSVWLHRLNRID